jgi:hypothetical protein
MSLSRRGFFNTAAGALAAPGKTATTKAGPGSAFLIGRWMVRSDELHFADAKTAYLRNPDHAGPQIKFPRGIPDRGDPARVYICWDVCYQRGEAKNRALGKMVLRVYPIPSLDRDAEIHIVETLPNALDGEECRPMRPIALHFSNRDCHQRDWYILKLNAETIPILRRALEPPPLPTPDSGAEVIA